MKRAFKILLDIFIYVGIVALIFWGLPVGLSKWLGTPYPMASITSGSMWPILKEGDLILIKGVKSKEELSVGDIVVWSNPKAMPDGRQGFTIHRIVKLSEKTLTTKGDANFKDDEAVRYEDIIGKAYKVGDTYIRIPYLGFISVISANIKN